MGPQKKMLLILSSSATCPSLSNGAECSSTAHPIATKHQTSSTGSNCKMQLHITASHELTRALEMWYQTNRAELPSNMVPQ
jgi:hypothetical protein